MMVDESRIDGSAKNVGGSAEEAIGDVIGDSETQAQGIADQIVGTTQGAVKSASDIVKGWSTVIGSATKERPFTTLAIAVGAGFVLRALTRTSRRS